MSFRKLSLLFATLLLIAPVSNAALKQPPDPDRTLQVYMAKGFPDAKLEGTEYSLPDSWYGISAPKPGDKELATLLASLGLQSKEDKPNADKKQTDKAPRLFETDLKAFLPSINPSFLLDEPTGTKYFLVTPAASYLFKNKTDFSVNCEFKVELIDGGKSTWTARYIINREATYSTLDTDVAAKLQQHFVDTFQLLTGMFALHRVKGDSLFTKLELTPGKMTSVKSVVVPYLPDRIVYLDDDGMVDEDPAHFHLAKSN